MIKLGVIVFIVVLIQINCNTCGRNCPSNTCNSCVCGTKTQIISSANCSKYAWNQNCCKFIVSKISNWNKHYMSESFDFLEIGLFGIDEDDAQQCNLKQSSLCYYGDNLKCAYEQYIDYGKSWGYWDYEATSCGCPVDNPQIIHSSKHQRRKKVNQMKKAKEIQILKDQQLFKFYNLHHINQNLLIFSFFHYLFLFLSSPLIKITTDYITRKCKENVIFGYLILILSIPSYFIVHQMQFWIIFNIFITNLLILLLL